MSLSYQNLNQHEKDQLAVLPIYIAVLIANADGKIDKCELNRAIKISQSAVDKIDVDLREYYVDAYQDFEDKLKLLLANLPWDNHEREKIILEQIRSVNEICDHVDNEWMSLLIASLKDIARKIASASGGTFGLGSIGFEELNLLNLHFLNTSSARKND